MNIEQIQKYMEKWSHRTYREETMYSFMSKQDREKVLFVLDELNLSNKKMIGNSVQGLPDIDEGPAGNIYFTEVFEQWTEGRYVTPITFILLLIKEFEKSGLPFEETVSSAVARGFRGFPSFIREIDLSDKLDVFLPECTCIRSKASEDMQEHTDIQLTYKGILYHISSYLNTKNGLSNMKSKIMGERGKIPYGYSLLCPFFMRNYLYSKSIYEWFLHKQPYLEKVKEVLDNPQIIPYNDLYNQSDYQKTQTIRNICIIYK